MIQKALAETVIVTEGGQRRRRTKLEVMVTQLANKAAGGDLKAIEAAIKLSSMTVSPDESARQSPDLKADREEAQKIIERLLAQAAEPLRAASDE